MTEDEWNSCTDPQRMLEFLRCNDTRSERKLRLFAVACCRRVWPLLTDERSRRAVEVAERYADGLAGDEELSAAWRNSFVAERESGLSADDLANGGFWAADAAGFASGEDAELAYSAADSASLAASWASSGPAAPSQDAERAIHAAILCDLFGPLPFRPVSVAPAVLAWDAGVVVKLAEAAYQERQMPSGVLDNARLMVLADALEEAGCADAELLWHLRQGGLHVRGCHAVDLLLNKE
jgi:hypothetical protein